MIRFCDPARWCWCTLPADPLNQTTFQVRGCLPIHLLIYALSHFLICVCHVLTHLFNVHTHSHTLPHSHSLTHWLIPSTDVGIVRYKTYEVLKEQTNNPRIVWAYLPYSMHMAGPREAIQHMIIRKNYGCTHFIIGRDMAGCKSSIDGKTCFDLVTGYVIYMRSLYTNNAFMYIYS